MAHLHHDRVQRRLDRRAQRHVVVGAGGATQRTDQLVPIVRPSSVRSVSPRGRHSGACAFDGTTHARLRRLHCGNTSSVAE
jgi:hypothetical protein